MIRIGRQSLTEGTIWKSIALFAIPLLLSNFLQQLYNTADLLIVGQYAGANAMASVGATGSVTGMLIGLSVGLATGCSVVISQMYGAEDYDGLYKSVHTAFAIALLGGVILTVGGIVLAPPLLTLMKTPEVIMPGAVTYMRIYFAGIIPTLIYNMGAGILNAVGDSRRPFFFLCVAAAVNVVCDLLFVGWLRLGVTGAAIATVIAQAAAASFVLIALIRTHSPYRYFPKETKLYGDIVSRIVKIGLPAGMQSVLISVSNVFIQVEINRFGEAAIAGVSVAGRVDGFIFVIMNAIGLSAMTFTGQNVGAGQMRRVRKGYLTSLVMVVLLAAGLGNLLLAFRNDVVGLFNNAPEVIYYATRMMSIILPLYFIFGINEVTGGYLRGQGKAMVPMIATLIFMCGARLLWIFLVLPFWDSIDVVFYAYPVSWFLTMVTLQVFGFVSYRKQKKLGLFSQPEEKTAFDEASDAAVITAAAETAAEDMTTSEGVKTSTADLMTAEEPADGVKADTADTPAGGDAADTRPVCFDQELQNESAPAQTAAGADEVVYTIDASLLSDPAFMATLRGAVSAEADSATAVSDDETARDETAAEVQADDSATEEHADDSAAQPVLPPDDLSESEKIETDGRDESAESANDQAGQDGERSDT